jgi:Zn-dependent protease with chaperone function
VIAGGLLAYAALLLACGPRVLARASWPDRVPRLAIAAWLALAWSVVTSVVLGGVALALPAVPGSGRLARLLADCVMALRAQYAHPGGAVLAGIGAVLAVTVTARLAWCMAVTVAAGARAGRRHRRGLRLAGRADARLDAIVVDHEEPAAYCLPGARRPVVLTSGALSTLDDEQVAAVVAHERAHQAGRHHLLLWAAASLAAAFPRVPAFRIARDEVARLAELAADDAAAARWPRLAVAEALLTLGAAPAGAAALGAGGSTAAARVQRLIAAPNPLSRAAAAGGALAVAAMIAFPVAALAGPAVTAAVTGHCAHSATTPHAAGSAASRAMPATSVTAGTPAVT